MKERMNHKELFDLRMLFEHMGFLGKEENRAAWQSVILTRWEGVTWGKTAELHGTSINMCKFHYSKGIRIIKSRAFDIAHKMPELTRLLEENEKMKMMLTGVADAMKCWPLDYENRSLKIRVLKITDCGFSVRLLNVLNASDIKTVDDITKYSRVDLLRFRNFGRRSFDELMEFLNKYNIKLKEQ